MPGLPRDPARRHRGPPRSRRSCPGVITKTAAKMSRRGPRRDRATFRSVRARTGSSTRRSRATSCSATSPGSRPPTGTRWPRRSRPTSSASARTATTSGAAREYAEFLEAHDRRRCRATSSWSSTSIADGNRVAVELNETVDDGDARLRTDETVVFDVRRRPDHAGRGVPADVGRASDRAGSRMTEPVCTLDLARMRRDRVAKLDAAMAAAGVDTLVLCGQQNVSYATGARVPAADHVRASWWRAVAVLERGAPWPHLYTDFPEGAPRRDARRVPAPRDRGRDRGRRGRARRARSAAGRFAIDDAPFPLWEALADARARRRGRGAWARRSSTKTPDELECIRQAQAINEAGDARSCAPLAVPGALATELSGAFLRAVAELGATANTVDPVFQVMPRSVADGPFSVTGEPVFPIPTRADELAGRRRAVDRHRHQPARLRLRLRRDVDHRPRARTVDQRDQFARWRAVRRPRAGAA